MIPFSGLSRFSGHFGGDGPSPLNRDTTVYRWQALLQLKSFVDLLTGGALHGDAREEAS